MFWRRTQQLTAKRESSNRPEGQTTGKTSCRTQDGKKANMSWVGSMSIKAPVSLSPTKE